MNNKKLASVIGLTAVLAATSGRADIVVTYGAAGAMSSSVPDSQVEDFNSPSLLGKDSNVSWRGVGTIDSVYVRTADMYGGANGSDYPVQSKWVGQPNEVPTSTLSLTSSSAYFGLWWSAGDGNNVLSFYEGSKLEATITTAGLLADLPSSYNGNPNTGFKGLDYHEDFAFLNFYGTAGTEWNSIVFSNLGTSGFESDNWTSRVAPWGQDPNDKGNYPGTEALDIPVVNAPEVPMTHAMIFGCLALAGYGLLRRKMTVTVKAGIC